MTAQNIPATGLSGAGYRYDDPFAPVFPESPAVVRLDGAAIRGWDDFHSQCAEAIGFPSFYGRNMDAWIDCLSDLRVDSKMTRFRLDSGQVLQIEVSSSSASRKVAPDVFDAFLDGATLVNQRGRETGYGPLLSIVLL